MDSARWATLSPLLDDLLELEPPVQARRLAEIAERDPGLAEELRQLLAMDEQRPDFLAQPVVDGGAFAPQPGQVIGPYRLESPIGEGGMGQVWLAVRADGLYQRRVALKLLRPGLGDAGLRVRFTRERQILARLGHAHIARLLDAGQSQDGQPYLALDYVQGEPITDYAEKLGLSVQTRLGLFLQVCAAVSHAHANLVVHRDLKPSNILVTPAGDVCLLDFGIAKLLDEAPGERTEITRTGTRAFTLHYAAPEQLRNEPVTTMTDVYSLGVVLYELLAGRKPYLPVRASDAAWEEAILNAEPMRPSQAAMRQAREAGHANPRRVARPLTGDLDNILLKALSKAPEARYASVEALAQDLRRHLDGQTVLARPQSLGYRTRKYLRRHALALAVIAIVGGFLAVALAFVSWQADRARAQAQRAQAMQDFVVALFENTERGGEGGAGLDVRTLLESGVRRADSELLAQPQARAELLGLIARLRAGLGDDRQALELLDRQMPLLGQLTTEAAQRIGLESAALRGRSLRALGEPQRCVAALAPWLSDSPALVRAFPLQAAELLAQLGRCHRQLGGNDVARDLFGQALALRRADGAARPAEAESQADLAMLLADDGKLPEAIAAMRGALQLLRGSGGDRNALGVEVWRGLGAMYLALGNRMESEASYRQALDIALGRFGVAHPATASVQQPLAALLLEVGKIEEAERLARLAHEQRLAQWGGEHPGLVGSWRLVGRALAELARPGDAIPAYAEALRLLRLAPDAPGLPELLCELAAIEIEAGDPVAAELHAGECRRESAGWPAPALALAVRLALLREDLPTARRALAELAALDRDAGNHAELTALLTAQVETAAGRPELAERALQPLLAAPARRGAAPGDGAWQARALAAAADCRAGRTSEGRLARRDLLLDVTAALPERRRLHRSLLELAAACGR